MLRELLPLLILRKSLLKI